MEIGQTVGGCGFLLLYILIDCQLMFVGRSTAVINMYASRVRSTDSSRTGIGCFPSGSNMKQYIEKVDGDSGVTRKGQFDGDEGKAVKQRICNRVDGPKG